MVRDHHTFLVSGVWSPERSSLVTSGTSADLEFNNRNGAEPRRTHFRVKRSIQSSKPSRHSHRARRQSTRIRVDNPVTTDEWNSLVKYNVVDIFENKPKNVYPLLAQMYDSDHTPTLNLTPLFASDNN